MFKPIIGLLLVATASVGQIAPTLYYTFDEVNPYAPTVGGGNLTGGGVHTINSGGLVGKYINWESNAGSNLVGPTVSAGFSATVQLLYRPNYRIDDSRNTLIINWDGFTISFEYPRIIFTTYNTTTGTGNNMVITLDGVGRGSWDYWMSDRWHHLALIYNGNTGRKEIWIDGQSPAGFSTTVSPQALNAGVFRINSGVSYITANAGIDEVAIYLADLPPRQVYQNYLDATAGLHYTTALAPSVPPPDPITAGIDLTEYAPDHPNYQTVTQIQQLDSFPLPRYKWGHTMKPNFNWGEANYVAGLLQPGVSTAQSATNDTIIQRELVTNWNYMLLLSRGQPMHLASTAALANANPSWPLSLISLRAQTPGGTKVWDQGLPANHYLQNGSGQFLDINGNVTSGTKYWRPTAPIASYSSDGTAWRGIIDGYPITRPINFINDNNELFALYSDAALNNDPVVNADRIASGLPQQNYLAARVSNNDTLAFRDIMMGSAKVSPTAKFTEYKIDGHRTFNFRYEQKRKTMTPFNGKYYSTLDFYPRYPNNWRYWQGPWHGWQWVVESRLNEIAVDDSLFSPFVAAGWNPTDETQNCRPAQWLGLLKAVHITGVDFCYTGYFNEAPNYTPPNPPPANPAGYISQLAAVPYAQAISSHYEEYLRNGTLLNGDVPASYVSPVDPGYTFYAGNKNMLVSVRQRNGADRYVIAATKQPYSNQRGNAPATDTAQIILDGDTMLFEVRRQGSVYIYDNTSPPSPVFWQLDGWHEYSHPYYWDDDFHVEAENYDSVTTGTVTRFTVRPNLQPKDWTRFTTYIGLGGAGSVNYRFQPRKTVNYYLFVRARSSNGANADLGMSLNGGPATEASCINDTAWAWYGIASSTGIRTRYTPGGDQNHWLTLTVSGANLQIDRFVLSTDSLLYTPVVTTCGSATATITPSGPTAFCQGGTVTLSANTGSSYLWNTGATTQNIVVGVSGSYAVTVTIAGVGSATSSPVTVTVFPRPTVNISFTGSPSFCVGDSVVLTATPAAVSYLWNTGATTQSIAVYVAATWLVTVTNVNGCTGISTPAVTTFAGDASGFLNAAASTDICSGDSVLLFATANGPLASIVKWQLNGVDFPAAGASIIHWAKQAGIWRVQFADGACTGFSTTISVTTMAPPTTANAGADQSICIDSTLLGGNTPVTGTGTWTLVSGTATINSPANPNTKLSGIAVGTAVLRWTIVSGLCSPSIDDVSVTRSGSAPVTIGITPTVATFCAGEPVTFMASGTNIENFQWVLNSVNVGTDTNTYTNTFSDGDFVWCVGTSSIGCATGSPAVSNTVTLTEGVTPTAAITPAGPTSFCAGGSVRLSAAHTTGNTYRWRKNGGNILGGTDSSYTATTAGLYDVIVTSGDGCRDTSSAVVVSVGVAATPSITIIGNSAICLGDSVRITGNAATSYLWNTGATTQSIWVSDPGGWAVTITDGSGCTAVSGTVFTTLTNPTSAIITPSMQTICLGRTTTLIANSSAAYTWSTGEITQSIVVNASGVYTVMVTASNGCTATSSAIILVVNCGTCPPPDSLVAVGFEVTAALDWEDIPAATAYIAQIIDMQRSDTTQITFNQSRAQLARLIPETQYSFSIVCQCGPAESFSIRSRKAYFRTRNVIQ